MSDREPPGGVWNAAGLFSGEAPPPPNASPPPNIPPPPPPSRPPQATIPASGRPDNRRVVIVAVAAVAVLAAVAGVGVIVLGRGDSPPAQAGSVGQQPADAVTTYITTEAATAPAEEDTEPTPADEPTTGDDAALASLEQLSADGLAAVSFHGQYAAQLASKYPGISDPLQTAESGSHTFAAADILAEHTRLRDEHAGAGHPVILLKSTDYGKRQRVGSHFLWVTFAIGDFPDKQSVLDWCDSRFAALPADERANQCAVRRLEPGR